MTDTEILRELLERQRRMEAALEALTRTPPAAAGPAHPNDLVGVDYFACVTGLAPVTILQGKAGTGAVSPASKRPRRWRKGDVDRFQRERATRLRSPREKAIRLLERKRA